MALFRAPSRSTDSFRTLQGGPERSLGCLPLRQHQVGWIGLLDPSVCALNASSKRRNGQIFRLDAVFNTTVQNLGGTWSERVG